MNDYSAEADDNRNDDNQKTNGNMSSLPVESPTAKANVSLAMQESITVSQESLSPSPTATPSPRNNCCSKMWSYGGIVEAKGYALNAMGRGAGVMSNVVVNAALLELASEAAGCLTGGELKVLEAAGEIIADDYKCTGTVYGQNPLSLISNIAVVTGVMGALFMPIIGVILDFTPYRRFVGILFSVIFTIIQGSQIAIGSRTWFPMAILQALAGFCFSITVLTSVAYLPEICEKVGQEKHARYTARFTAKQFSVQASFLILLGALAFAFGISDNTVQTARLSQALNVGIISVLFGLGWRYCPTRPANRELPQENMRCCGIIMYGFRQNIRTAKSIHRTYKKGLRWYLLATVFVQSSVGALSTISVVYLSSEVGLTGADISLFFLFVMLGTIPGATIASALSKYTNPNTSWQLSMLCLFTTVVIGAFTLGNAANKYFSLIWGFFVGAFLGWFYPTENLFFSCVLPKGQEAEIAGFRVYCSMILAWFPPLIFSVAVENGVDVKWGMTIMGSFILVAALLLKLGAGTWEEILRESGRSELAGHEATADRADSVNPATEMIQAL
mmetsp:Transcript_17705/g.42651  ORF Transcript_17705/g.42651 Transcript_17705/m.42651 type:complete len:560 (-) Transcript_17705:302-1981(-)